MADDTPLKYCLNCGRTVDDIEQPCKHCARTFRTLIGYTIKNYNILEWLQDANNKLYTREKLAHAVPTVSQSLTRLNVVDVLQRIDKLTIDTMDVNDYIFNGIHATVIVLRKILQQPVTLQSVQLTPQWVQVVNSVRSILATPHVTYPCLNPDCRNRIAITTMSKTVTCTMCHSEWTVTALKNSLYSTVEQSDVYMSSKQCAALLTSVGYEVTASGVRNWAQNNPNIDRNDYGYRISDVYKHAVTMRKEAV